MKNRLNITIDKALVDQAKRYAARNKTSLSQLIERYLKTLVSRPKPKKQTFLEYLDSLPKPKKKVFIEGDQKSAYYESRKEKYGF